ncbi:MAG TPA: DUF805 domain-containing protein [Magnetospirillum sp.]|nr:DUF805 domain-containing protein [Magnetospirillum sp.]
MSATTPQHDIRPNLGWFLFSFRGRIGRWQFWQFVVTLLAFAIVEGTALRLLNAPIDDILVWQLVLMLYPKLAVTAKRWHDLDRSAAWLLLLVLPYVGDLWTVVECGFRPGTPGPNRFGTLSPELENWALIPRRRHAPGPGADGARPAPPRRR